MARKIKSNNLSGRIAAELFAMMNKEYVTFKNPGIISPYLVVTINPNDDKLIYPHGWYFGDGCFRNKHQSTSGIYEEITMVDKDLNIWEAEAVTPSEMKEVTTLH